MDVVNFDWELKEDFLLDSLKLENEFKLETNDDMLFLSPKIERKPNNNLELSSVKAKLKLLSLENELCTPIHPKTRPQVEVAPNLESQVDHSRRESIAFFRDLNQNAFEDFVFLTDEDRKENKANSRPTPPSENPSTKLFELKAKLNKLRKDAQEIKSGIGERKSESVVHARPTVREVRISSGNKDAKIMRPSKTASSQPSQQRPPQKVSRAPPTKQISKSRPQNKSVSEKNQMERKLR